MGGTAGVLHPPADLSTETHARVLAVIMRPAGSAGGWTQPASWQCWGRTPYNPAACLKGLIVGKRLGS